MNATDKKAILQKYQAIFNPFIGKEVTITFAQHTFPVTFSEVRLATQKQLANVPDARNNGKKPQVIQFCFEGDTPFNLNDLSTFNSLDFVLEDIIAAHSTLKGAEIQIG